MMRLVYACFIFLCFLVFVSSCEKSPNGGIPFYMKMDSASVVYQNQPLNPVGITDVWVQTNTTNLGAYEIPTNFPVVQANPVTFLLSAGVWQSGQSTARNIYPFYDVDTFTLNATAGAKYTHHPKFTYLPATIFAFPTETFEFNNDYDSMSIVPNGDSNVIYLGHHCGKMTTTLTDTDITAIQNITPYALPAGQEVWLEMDYKCDVPFWVGIIGNYNGSSPSVTQVLFVIPIPYWNKVYIKLSNIVGNLRADTYQLYFEALTPTGGTAGSVYLDNIKVVHF